MKTLIDYRNMLAQLDLLKEDNSCAYSYDHNVLSISYNSMEVQQGTLFICKGENFKREYLLEAIDKGACGYVAEDNYGVDIPCIIVNNIRSAISKISSFYFDKSWEKGLKIIGLTGTKGKSTTATMIKSILDLHCGKEIGFSSGIYTYDGQTKQKSRKLTTPETIELHKILNGCVDHQCQYLVMEVSSQGLKYGRTEDLNFEICGFLNISPDHISDVEHSDMEDYFNSKLKIFQQSRMACINLDMDESYLPEVLEAAQKGGCQVVTFGFSGQAEVQGISVEELPGAILLKSLINGTVQEFNINIGGAYNATNALAAIAICHKLGIPMEIIKQGLKQVKVAGRMETYSLDRNVDVIVDCAHNKMSYEALFDYIRQQYPGRRIGFVFGCVGGKAYNRRQEAGEIADANADFIIITERDPGKEDVKKICEEILSYIQHKEKAQIVIDRDEAVKIALKKAEELGDCVVILAGCGSDAYIKRGNQLIEFATDGERVQKYLGKME